MGLCIADDERIVFKKFCFYFLVVPCSTWILVPRSETEPKPLALRACIVSTTGPSWESQNDHIEDIVSEVWDKTWEFVDVSLNSSDCE